MLRVLCLLCLSAGFIVRIVVMQYRPRLIEKSRRPVEGEELTTGFESFLAGEQYIKAVRRTQGIGRPNRDAFRIDERRRDLIAEIVVLARHATRQRRDLPRTAMAAYDSAVSIKASMAWSASRPSSSIKTTHLPLAHRKPRSRAPLQPKLKGGFK